MECFPQDILLNHVFPLIGGAILTCLGVNRHWKSCVLAYFECGELPPVIQKLRVNHFINPYDKWDDNAAFVEAAGAVLSVERTPCVHAMICLMQEPALVSRVMQRLALIDPSSSYISMDDFSSSLYQFWLKNFKGRPRMELKVEKRRWVKLWATLDRGAVITTFSAEGKELDITFHDTGLHQLYYFEGNSTILFASAFVDCCAQIYHTAGLDLPLVRQITRASAEVLMVQDVPGYTMISSVYRMGTGNRMAKLFDDSVLLEWLQPNEAQRRAFVRSSAAWAAVSYILGIGDRHNDNVGITKREGTLVYTDLRFLFGKYRRKFGRRREVPPFVFTAAMQSVMGEEYPLFCSLVEEALNVLRLKHNQMQLFKVCAAHKQDLRDIAYLYDTLNHEFDVPSFIENCLALSARTHLNDLVHIIAH